jgi:hypothetical protein
MIFRVFIGLELISEWIIEMIEKKKWFKGK